MGPRAAQMAFSPNGKGPPALLYQASFWFVQYIRYCGILPLSQAWTGHWPHGTNPGFLAYLGMGNLPTVSGHSVESRCSTHGMIILIVNPLQAQD